MPPKAVLSSRATRRTKALRRARARLAAAVCRKYRAELASVPAARLTAVRAKDAARRQKIALRQAAKASKAPREFLIP